MNKNLLKKKIDELVYRSAFELPEDVLLAIVSAYRKETNPKAKDVLKMIVDNAKSAKDNQLAICQDTGFPVIFIEAGKNVKITRSLIETIEKGVALGYKSNSLRASVVDPVQRSVFGFDGLVWHLRFTKNNKTKITLLPKGFGSENKSALRMFDPTADWQEIEKFVVDSVKQAGPSACPPFVVGIGLGGTADECLSLAKESLLSDIRILNPDTVLRKHEKNLLQKINALNLGPMGFGGKTTALAVRIKKAPTHIAGLPVGLNISCHALRRASVVL